MKQIYIKDYQKKIVLISVVIVFGTFFASQRLIIKPQKDRLAKLRYQLEHIRLEDEVAKIYNEANACEKSLPPQKDPSWLISQITEMAKESKIGIESIEPLPIKQISPYSYVPFKIKTKCSFSALVRFIDLIESSPYILSIESLKLEPQGKYTTELQREEIGQEVLASIEMVIGTIY